MHRDPRWERVSASIRPDEFGRRIEIEVRGLSGHRLGQVFIVSPHDEPYVGAILDSMVRELDKALHA